MMLQKDHSRHQRNPDGARAELESVALYSFDSGVMRLLDLSPTFA